MTDKNPGEGGRVVLVTGGAKGIGLACARAFSEHGDSVAITYRSAPPVEEEPAIALAVPCDVTDDGQIAAIFAALAGRWSGGLDIVVHSLAFAAREDLKGRFLDT